MTISILTTVFHYSAGERLHCVTFNNDKEMKACPMGCAHYTAILEGGPHSPLFSDGGRGTAWDRDWSCWRRKGWKHWGKNAGGTMNGEVMEKFSSRPKEKSTWHPHIDIVNLSRCKLGIEICYSIWKCYFFNHDWLQFSKNRPFGRFFLVVAMSVYMFICLYKYLSVCPIFM